MKTFIVLGGYGIIGKAVVLDLFKSKDKDCEIIIAGRDLEKAKKFSNSFKSPRVKSKKLNLNNKKELISLIQNSDACINCLQYYFNLEIMNACIKAKTNYIDLGGLFYMTKKQLKLHKEFEKINKLAILGCGATPGITNILAAYGSKFVKKINSVEILFADIDKTKYAQPFILPYSFKTIIDEYIMKPAVFENGELKFFPPHSGIKKYDFGKEFGKQRGFYTLHSELATLPEFLKDKKIKNLSFRATFGEKFSGVIESLIALGFASREKIKANNESVEIMDITSKLMEKFIPKPETKINDKEMIRIVFNSRGLILDAITSSKGNLSAGVLDTGIPCSIIAQMIADKNGVLKESGVYAPEKVINPETFFKELNKRKIYIYRNNRRIN